MGSQGATVHIPRQELQLLTVGPLGQVFSVERLLVAVVKVDLWSRWA